MVRVFLLKYIDEVAARNINPLTFRVISHVIDHAPTRKTGNYGAGIGIQNDQLSGIARGDKQSMSSFVKSHSDIVLRLLPNRPGCDHRVLFDYKPPTPSLPVILANIPVPEYSTARALTLSESIF